MNLTEAVQIRRAFFDNQTPTEEEIFAYTEAMTFLIRETKNPDYMMELGGFYYEERNFELALKYYELAAEYDYPAACVCLGYIWYYGRTGKRDYEKAFHYYSRGMENGDLQAAYKVADMYKNGYYVEKDYGRYCAIIEELYPKIRNAMYLNDPLPEIYTRLARIRMEQERYDEARALLLQAKAFLAERIAAHPFFGDLNIMKWLEEDLYRLPDGPGDEEFDLFDLFVVLREPSKVCFRYRRAGYEVRSVMEEGECVICFDGKWFRTVDDFFARAALSGNLLTAIYQDLYGWEVTGDDRKG